MSFDGQDPWSPEDGRLPSSPEAEMMLLGAVLYDNEAFHLVEDVVQPNHFYEPLHGKLWEVVGSTIKRGHRAEPIVIAESLKGSDALSDVGGMSFLGMLVDRAPGPQDAPHFAEVVADLAMRREVHKITKEASQKALQPAEGVTGAMMIAEAEKRLANLASTGPKKATYERAGGIYLRQLHRSRNLAGAAPGTISGIQSLDDLMGGFRNGTCNTIAARPGMGKSALAVQLAVNIARRGIPVHFYSAEMPEEQVITRVGCSLVYERGAAFYSGKSINPSYEDFEKGELTERQWEMLEKGHALIDTLPLYFEFDRPTVSHIHAASRRLKRECERDGMEGFVVITDHMLKIKSERVGRADPTADLTQVSNDLLEASKSMNVPFINLMQINRGVEGREDKRPGLSDLKQSGTVEEDSFSVSFLMRPEYYNRPPEDDNDDKAWAKFKKTKDRWDRKLLWILEKNRGGQGQKQVELFCDIGCNAIQDLSTASRDETGRILFPTGGEIFS